MFKVYLFQFLKWIKPEDEFYTAIDTPIDCKYPTITRTSRNMKIQQNYSFLLVNPFTYIQAHHRACQINLPEKIKLLRNKLPCLQRNQENAV